MQQTILEWFTDIYPNWQAGWVDSNFDVYNTLPTELKMVPALCALEHNLIKGGWTQFLWNCHGSWREIIAIAWESYHLIGDAEEALAALDSLTELCVQHEADCEKAIELEDGSMTSFTTFCKRSHLPQGDNRNSWEMLLWSGTDVYWRRLDWLETNQAHLTTLMNQNSK